MGLERCVVDAVLIEKRSPTEIARAHGISRSWLYTQPATTSPSAVARAVHNVLRQASGIS